MHDSKGLHNLSEHRFNFVTRYTINEIIIIYKGIPLSLVVKNSNEFNISTDIHARAYMYTCVYIYIYTYTFLLFKNSMSSRTPSQTPLQTIIQTAIAVVSKRT
jgi:hypothetical protein